MARITVDDCLAEIGNTNRFALIHLALERVKQHYAGEPFLVDTDNKEIVNTLREIASGKVTFDNIFHLTDDNDPASDEDSTETEATDV